MPDESLTQPLPENGDVNLVTLIHEPEWKTILLDLVRSEKLNVWNIDVSMLSQKYLERIREMQDSNLRVPANAILCCAILVKTKSKDLRFPSLEEAEREPEITEEERMRMESMLSDLTSSVRVKEGQVSLDELVENIETIIEKTKVKARRARDRTERPDFSVLLGEGDIEERIEEVYQRVISNADASGMVVFSQIVPEKNAHSMVDTFIPLLFLTGKDKIAVWQDAFFGEIFISLVNSGITEAGGIDST